MNDALLIALKYSFAWCDVNNIAPPIELCVQAVPVMKSLPFFSKTIQRLVKSLYDGFIGGEFVDTLKNLIRGQMRRAYEEAWTDDGNALPLPPYLEQAAAALADEQAGYVDGYYKAIIDARVDKSPIEPLQSRAELWANRYTQAKNDAIMQITAETGGKLVWIEGDTEDKCETCLALNGIVAYATEWQISGFKPQNAPNPLIECGGWHCQCRLENTNKRRTANALDRLLTIATARNV